MSFAPGALGVPLRKDGKAEVDGSPGMLMKISEQAQVTTPVNALIDEESRSDVKRLLKSSADTMEQQFAGLNAWQARLDGILDRVDTLLDTGPSLQTITKRVDETLLTTSGLMAEGKLAATIGPRTDSTMASVESVVTRIDQAFGDEQHGLPQIMADTSSSLNSLADILGQLKDGRGVIGQLLRSIPWPKISTIPPSIYVTPPAPSPMNRRCWCGAWAKRKAPSRKSSAKLYATAAPSWKATPQKMKRTQLQHHQPLSSEFFSSIKIYSLRLYRTLTKRS